MFDAPDQTPHIVLRSPELQQRGLFGGAVVAGLAVLLVAAAIVIVVAVRSAPSTATGVVARSATPRASAGPTSEQSASPPAAPGGPLAILEAPAAIAEYEKPADQTPAKTLARSHPVPDLERPFSAYYREPSGHTATIWGGTGQAYDRSLDQDAIDPLLTSLGPFGGVAADHFRVSMGGIGGNARCSQFSSQGQRGTSCVWAGDGVVLVFVFGGLDAPGASDTIGKMVGKIVLY